MTGEMCWINQEGVDSNGDRYWLHAAAAKAVSGVLKPFDVYQGPYILLPDLCVNSKVWLCDEGERLYWYREDTNKRSEAFFPNEEFAIQAIKTLM